MALMLKTGVLTSLTSRFNELSLLDSSSSCTNFKSSGFSQCNVILRCSRLASIIPSIRAQSTPDYVPDSKFYKVEAILRPWRIQKVSSALLKMGIRGVTVSDVRGFGAQGGSTERHDALLKMGIRGVTVSDVRGFGAQGGSTERHGGSEFSEDKFVAKVKLETVVSKDQVEAVIDKVIGEGRTGEIGDGKIFVIPISDVIRVRTGERGEDAEKMMGGPSDMPLVA